MALHRHLPNQQGQTPSMYVHPHISLSTYSLNTNNVAIPNLYCLQTLASVKAADALDRALEASGRPNAPLNVLLQVNTSSEDEKSGLPPLIHPQHDPPTDGASTVQEETPLVELALHVIRQCPHLRLQGLMTIGSLAESLSSEEINQDFETLRLTRDSLEEVLRGQLSGEEAGRWGEEGRLLLSMGMSSEFEAALKAGSDIVRVGTGIFGQRHLKGAK